MNTEMLNLLREEITKLTGAIEVLETSITDTNDKIEEMKKCRAYI